MSDFDDFNQNDLQKRFDALADIVADLVQLMPIIDTDTGSPDQPAPNERLAHIREKQQKLLNGIGHKLTVVRHGCSLLD